MSQANLDYNLQSCLFEIYVNIITHFKLISIKLYFPAITAGIFSRLTYSCDSFVYMGKDITAEL